MQARGVQWVLLLGLALYLPDGAQQSVAPVLPLVPGLHVREPQASREGGAGVPVFDCWVSRIDRQLPELQQLGLVVGQDSGLLGLADAPDEEDHEDEDEREAQLAAMLHCARQMQGDGARAVEFEAESEAQEQTAFLMREEEGSKRGPWIEAARLSTTEAITDLEVQVLQHNPWLRRYPLLLDTPATRERAVQIAHEYRGKFCWSTNFSPNFLAGLIRQGYLPMAEELAHGPARYILLPKLHQERCILRFDALHVQRSVRKRAKRFEVSCDTCFERVVTLCKQQHGENWLYPPIVEAFKAIATAGATGIDGVRMHSFEVWDKASGALVAGEIGYSLGGCYTSLSGFFTVDSAGSVQCVATARLLQQAGASFWDLGMALEYKRRMGAKCIPRAEFLHELSLERQRPAVTLPKERQDCEQFVAKRVLPGREGGVLDAGAEVMAAGRGGETLPDTRESDLLSEVSSVSSALQSGPQQAGLLLSSHGHVSRHRGPRAGDDTGKWFEKRCALSEAQSEVDRDSPPPSIGSSIAEAGMSWTAS